MLSQLPIKAGDFIFFHGCLPQTLKNIDRNNHHKRGDIKPKVCWQKLRQEFSDGSAGQVGRYLYVLYNLVILKLRKIRKNNVCDNHQGIDFKYLSNHVFPFTASFNIPTLKIGSFLVGTLIDRLEMF